MEWCCLLKMAGNGKNITLIPLRQLAKATMDLSRPGDFTIRTSMKRTQLCLAAVVSFAFALFALSASAASNTDHEALEKTGSAIRAAFAAGDLATVMKYHHPDVTKALAYNKLLVGRDAVAADLGNTLRQYHLEFVENRVESLLIENDTAVEMTLFTIRSTPIAGGQSSLFKGRTMVVYVRYKESPTGWASIRELIQPATD